MTNPIAYKRLKEEIDDLGDDVYDSTKLAHLPYLNATMSVYHLDLFEGYKKLTPFDTNSAMNLCGYCLPSSLDLTARPKKEAEER